MFLQQRIQAWDEGDTPTLLKRKNTCKHRTTDITKQTLGQGLYERDRGDYFLCKIYKNFSII